MQPLTHRPSYEADLGQTALRHALARLTRNSADFADERRAIHPDLPQLMQAILREVDETVLPRRYMISGRAGPLVCLSVVSRRLVAVEPSITGEDPDTTRTGPSAVQFLQMIEAACAGGGPFTLAPAGRDERVSEAGQSCTAQDLRDALGTGSASGKVQAFFNRHHPNTVSWLFVADDGPQFGGDARHQDVLTTLADRARTPAPDRVGTVVKPTCTVLPLGDDHRVIISSDQTALYLCVVTPEQAVTATAAWRTA